MAKRKSLRKLKRRLNQTTFLLVLGIGLLSMMTILNDPNRRKSGMADREPASVAVSPTEAPEPVKTASILRVDCEPKTEAVSWTQQVRLRGKICQSDDRVHIISSRIENRRNGYVATVFHQDNEFTTDFIQLAQGANQLIVKHTLSDGKVEVHDLTINRQ